MYEIALKYLDLYYLSKIWATWQQWAVLPHGNDGLPSLRKDPEGLLRATELAPLFCVLWQLEKSPLITSLESSVEISKRGGTEGKLWRTDRKENGEGGVGVS